MDKKHAVNKISVVMDTREFKVVGSRSQAVQFVSVEAGGEDEMGYIWCYWKRIEHGFTDGKIWGLEGPAQLGVGVELTFVLISRLWRIILLTWVEADATLFYKPSSRIVR